MLSLTGPAACVGVLIFAQGMIGLMSLAVIRDNANLTSVPQDINVVVTSLSLQYNDLIVIHNGSFPLYARLKKLQLSRNPLEEIESDTFDNNPELRTLICDHCSLHLFPVDFGPASTSLNKLQLAFGIKDIAAFGQMRFERFTSLTVLGLFGVKVTDMNIIKFPTSITNLGMSAMKLTIFPNLTFDRLPNLKFVRLEKNKFQEGSNFFGVTEVIEGIYIESSNLHSADGLDLLPKIAVLDIKDNELETIPDLLGLPNIRKLYINGNSRMNCDQRMCWRRLWDRMREPIEDSDDVICVEPPLLAGRAMSTVNPKFMHCINDSRFSPLFKGPSYFSTNRVVPVNTTITTARFRKDFNYDVVMNKTLSSSIAIYARSRAECSTVCLQGTECHGILFNKTAPPRYENCKLLGPTNCGSMDCS